MDFLREYALSIIVTVMICSVVMSLLQKNEIQGIVRMVCGMVISIAVIAPLWNVNITLPTEIDTILTDSAQDAVDYGTALSREALEEFIIRESEAYVLEKAGELNAEITVEIRLSEGDSPVPEAAVISGEVTAHEKQQLADILQTQLGITKECQKWTG